MSNRSRVEKYAELRKKIDNMDVYTFDDPDIAQKAEAIREESLREETIDEAMSPEEVKQAHIKKNTLSLTIDELIKQHEDYTRTLEKAEIEKRVKGAKKEFKAKRAKVSLTVVLLSALGIIVIIAVVILILITQGAI